MARERLVFCPVAAIEGATPSVAKAAAFASQHRARCSPLRALWYNAAYADYGRKAPL